MILNTFLFPLCALIILIPVAFSFYYFFKRKDVADVFWGLGFFIVTVVSYIFSTKTYLAHILMILVTLWSLRLSVHIFLRNRLRGEDFRYEKWRGVKEVFFKVFLLQPLILYLIASPIFWAMSYPITAQNPFFVASLFFWLSGFILETLSDYQLYQFKKDNKNQGKVLQTGLWSYCRHPNHLGEISQWWAIWVLTLGVSGSIYFVFSPLLLSYLILFVSGVAPLEEKLKKNKDLNLYLKNVPKIFPPSYLSGLIFTLSWYLLIYYGFFYSSWISSSIFVIAVVLSFILFYFSDKKSFYMAFFMTFYSVGIGALMELAFIKSNLLSYVNSSSIPLGLLYIYALFGLVFNSSFSFFSKSFLVGFFVGGGGAFFSYLFASRIGVDQYKNFYSLLYVSISWGFFVIGLSILHRLLSTVYDDLVKQRDSLTIIFDKKCPICVFEMKKIKKKGSPHINCEAPADGGELSKITKQFSFDEAMKEIHAFDDDRIYKGTEALSQMYAKSSYMFLAIFLQAPLFKYFFKCMYKIWATIRPRR